MACIGSPLIDFPFIDFSQQKLLHTSITPLMLYPTWFVVAKILSSLVLTIFAWISLTWMHRITSLLVVALSHLFSAFYSRFLSTLPYIFYLFYLKIIVSFYFVEIGGQNKFFASGVGNFLVKTNLIIFPLLIGNLTSEVTWKQFCSGCIMLNILEESPYITSLSDDITWCSF